MLTLYYINLTYLISQELIYLMDLQDVTFQSTLMGINLGDRCISPASHPHYQQTTPIVVLHLLNGTSVN